LTGSTENTTPSSGLEGPIGFDFISAELEPLGTMIDVPADFDWVSCPVIFQILLKFFDLFGGKFRTYTPQDMFDTQLRPQDSAGPSWPDLMEDFATGNDGYYNF
jgi:hypothetical protein